LSAGASGYDDEAGVSFVERTKVKIGGYWFDFDFYQRRFADDVEPEGYKWKRRRYRFHRHLNGGPDVWVGRLSRSGVVNGTASADEAIPQVCQRLMRLFGSRVLVMVNDALIAGVKASFADARPHEHYSQACCEDVVAFLEMHRGKRAWLD
jgi:hypothetical protein